MRLKKKNLKFKILRYFLMIKKSHLFIAILLNNIRKKVNERRSKYVYLYLVYEHFTNNF